MPALTNFIPRGDAPIWTRLPVNMVLDTIHDGSKPSTFFPMNATFAVDWNHNTGYGNASLVSVNQIPVDFSRTDTKAHDMLALGVAGELDFMSRGKHWVTLQDGSKFYAYRIILDMRGEEPEYAKRSAAVMLGEEGDDVIVTANWGEGEKGGDDTKQ